MTRILEPSEQNLGQAAAAIRRGKLVAMPTETVYGLAAAAFNEEAVAQVFQVKERPRFDPLIVHVGALSPGQDPLEALAAQDILLLEAMQPGARELARALAAAFWPGPLTLVLPKKARVPDLVTAGLETVAVRMPSHPVAARLIELAGTPLAAPSANRFGRISPTSAAAVAEELGSHIDIILDGGPCRWGLESTVLSLAGPGGLLLLRPGAVSSEQIAEITGAPPARAAGGRRSASPGRLESHYAPRKPLFLLPRPVDSLSIEELPAGCRDLPAGAQVGLLIQSGDPKAAARRLSELLSREVIARSLSRSGDLVEAARHLFAFLRELDNSQAACILAEPSPSREGLGYAVQDRLTRASQRVRRV